MEERDEIPSILHQDQSEHLGTDELLFRVQRNIEAIEVLTGAQIRMAIEFSEALIKSFVVIPRYAGKLPEEIIKQQAYQELLTEIGLIAMKVQPSNIEGFSLLMMEFPFVFRNREIIRKNPEFQKLIGERLNFMESHGQFGRSVDALRYFLDESEKS